MMEPNIFDNPGSLKRGLEVLEDQGLIRSRPHLTLPLRVYGYTDQCQYSRAWNRSTRNIRSMVVDTNTWEVVSQSMPKVFNLGEPGAPEDIDPDAVYVKKDGKLINLFMYKGELIVSSRGAFHNWECFHAKEIIDRWLDRAKSQAMSWMTQQPRYTMCFELIHPEHRIVVDYGSERNLHYLCSINQSTWEIDHRTHRHIFDFMTHGIDSIDFDKVNSLEDLARENIKGKEGYMVYGKNGKDMVKIKFDNYKELARAQCRLNSKRLFDAYEKYMLGDPEPLQNVIDVTPDEYYPWISKTIDTWMRALMLEVNECVTEYGAVQAALVGTADLSRKRFSETIPPTFKAAELFNLKDLNMEMFLVNILKRIKPKVAEPAKIL